MGIALHYFLKRNAEGNLDQKFMVIGNEARATTLAHDGAKQLNDGQVCRWQHKDVIGQQKQSIVKSHYFVPLAAMTCQRQLPIALCWGGS